MKKSAIALAVAGTLVASAVAQAETTFYGRLAAAIAYGDPDIDGTDGNWDIVNSGSRWGVRGSQDLGNGLSAIYHLETAVNAPEYNGAPGLECNPVLDPVTGLVADPNCVLRRGQQGRLAWVGLKGGFGAVKLGAQWSPYYNVAGRADIFNEARWYSYYMGPFRINNALLYETPDSLGNFKGEIVIQMDGARGEDGADNYGLGFNYDGGSWGGGFAYRRNENNDSDQFTAAGSIDFAGASIAAMYERFNGTANNTQTTLLNDANIWYLTGQYKFGNNIAKLGWGYRDPKNASSSNEWAIGIQHNLNSRTRVWAEYGKDNNKDLVNGFDPKAKPSVFTLGLRHDF